MAKNVYDADGNRLVRKALNGDITLYLGDTEIKSSSGALSSKRFYSYNGSTVAMRTGSGLANLTFFSDDQNGTASLQINANTAAYTKRYFKPFGASRGSDTTSSWVNDHGYLDKPTDDTGLTAIGARYYDPALGKFLSVDPLIDTGDQQQINGYTDANSSPITFSDPSGAMLVDNNGSGVNYVRTGSSNNKNVSDIRSAAVTSVAPAPAASTGGGGGGFLGGLASVARAVTAPARIAVSAGVATLNDGIRESWEGVKKGATIFKEVVVVPYVDQIKGCIGSGDLSDCASLALDVGLTVATGGVAGIATKLAVTGLKAGFRAYKGAKAVRRLEAAASKVGKVCMRSFDADTPVLMADGSRKPIADIEIGDWVVATNPATGEQAAKPVTGVWVHRDELIDLDLDRETIRTTDDHPFWSIDDQMFENASGLTHGEKVLTAAGEQVTVRGLNWMTYRPGTAYNLTVADFHTYHVGTSDILVHNCDGLAADGADDVVKITRYSRRSGATTRAQKKSVQGRPCVDCGDIAERQVADHIEPLVKEHYRTGAIDRERMKLLGAVQPQCPTCSARQGAALSRYSIAMRRSLGLE